MLSHWKLDVYKCAMEFLAVVAEIIEQIPRGYSFLAGELKRASTSMPQNIAEGSGKPGKADRARYFGIAKGSAMECGSILDVCSVMKLVEMPLLQKGSDLVHRIVSMLSRMIGF